MKQDWIGFISDINTTEKKFLGNLLDFCSDEREVSSETLQREMQLSGARISQIINIFEKYALVTSRHENLGRGRGRRRLIKFSNKDVYDEINNALQLF